MNIVRARKKNMPDILSPKPINCELRGMAKSFESFESMEIVTRVQERTI